MEHLILIKRWENQINICATFVDDNNFETEADPDQFPQDNIPNGMYDLILHLALYNVCRNNLSVLWYVSFCSE